jgi:hemolysin activation/secretion protein
MRLVAEDNVNSRYTVESIEVAGESQPALPQSLKERLASMIGARFDPAQFDELAQEIRKQLHLRSVEPHIVRGTSPDRIRVLLVTERRSVEFDVSVPKFLYHSSEGWTAEAQASTTIARTNVLRVGLVSDADELTGRFSGVTAGYENLSAGGDRVHTAFLLEDFHEQWTAATTLADGPNQADLYRSRRNLQPEAIFLLSKPLSLTVGVSFEQMQMESPAISARNANAILAIVRYSSPIEGFADPQQIDASYSLRTAYGLGGDYHYTRHRAAAQYSIQFGRSTLADEAVAGYISGSAPLYERFVVGTSSLLRGWNRSEIDPLGGNRILHNSVDYSLRVNSWEKPSSFVVFYDAGVLWNQGQSAPVRTSMGVGYRQSIFNLALAFPFREGRVEPVFMVGMNY